jgi:protein-disulfide isomerase
MKKALLLVLMAFAVACATTGTQKPAPAAAAASPAVALLNGNAVTEKELNDLLGTALIVKQQEEYALKREALNDLIFMKLQEEAAKKEGITADALYKKKVTDAAAEPTEEQINTFYTQNKSRMNAAEEEAKKQIKDYLKNQAMGEKEQAFRKELMAAAKVDIKMRPPRLEIPKGTAPVKGPAGAPVTIMEYTDFQCPYCSRVQETLTKVFETYKDKVSLVFRDFPLDMHKDAKGAHLAARCAAEQGKFWEYHDVLFKNQRALSADDLKKYATDLSLDLTKFTACTESKKFEKDLQVSLQEGQGLGVTGTPCFFINGRALKGAVPFDSFKQIIDEEIAFAAQNTGN